MRARRLPVTDEYAEGGEAAVFVNGNVVVLSMLATRLLGLVDEQWTELDMITADLIETFGEPPDGTPAHVAAAHALEALRSQGIVDLAHP